MSLDWNSTVLEIAEQVRKRLLSPLEVIDYYLERIDSLNGSLNAVSHRSDRELREEAVSLLSSLSGDLTGQLCGVPIAVKALTSVAGWPIDLASRAEKGKTENISHDVIAAFRKAGMPLLCQTTSPEFGSLPVTESKLYGATRNPWNLDYSPGGSSGGSAACVAAGLAPVAEASDGGGSIRIPASCCGLVGLKPSRGRVVVGPVFCESQITTKGVLTRTVADTAVMLDVISSQDPLQWNRAPEPALSFGELIRQRCSPKRVGYTLHSPLGNSVHPECVTAVEQTLRLLEELGHEVIEAEPDWKPAEEFVENFLIVWAAHIGDIQVSDEALVEPHNRFLRQRAMSTSCVEYRKGLVALQRLSRRVASAWFEKFDVFVTPTIATLPPKIGDLLEDVEKDPEAPFYRCFEVVPFTPWFNVTGQPAISLPIHISAEGLPVGVQIVGRPWDEATLLQLGRALEDETGWLNRRPTIS